MTKRKNEILKIISVLTFIVCIVPLFERGSSMNGASSKMILHGKELNCAIDCSSQKYGMQTDFNYELLQNFANDNHCNVKITAKTDGCSYADSLKAGVIDLAVLPANEVNEGLCVSKTISDSYVWAVRNENESQIKEINKWLSYFENTAEYSHIKGKYDRTYNPNTRAEKGIISKTVSPYDHIFKKYAAQLDWDWRMLAAMAYQESKFAINTRSHRGAMGLMQVMPGTARIYGVENLLDPESNVKAGTQHLKRLQNMFKRHGLEGEELVKFTLAAYNAGEGRIFDCRNFAASRNTDSSKWDEVVNLIPLMREDSILDEASVKLGKFQGTETIAYVDNIMSLYGNICSICPEK